MEVFRQLTVHKVVKTLL